MNEGTQHLEAPATPEEQAEFNQIWEDQREGREDMHRRDHQTLAELQNADNPEPSILQMYEYRVDMQTGQKERQFGEWLEMTREHAQEENNQRSKTMRMRL